MFKKHFSLLLVFTVMTAALPLHAQWWRLRPRRGVLKPAPHQLNLSQPQISTLLQKRVENSLLKANREQLANAMATDVIDLRPSVSVGKTGLKNPQQIYPQMADLLTTQSQWDDYIISNNNRRILAEMPRTEKQIQQMEQNFEQLYQAQQTFPIQQDQFMEVLAEQIPADTRYLLLGETHNELTRSYVADFLDKFRAKYPSREIIFLTEFLDDEGIPQKRVPKALRDRNFPQVFDVARRLKMPVIGLEPKFVGKNLIRLRDVADKQDSFWSSLEGMALRNEQWLKIIRRQRQEHPEALFIIYAGLGHLSYQHPYSLGKILSGEQTFMVSLRLSSSLQLPNEAAICLYDHFSQSYQSVSPFIKFDHAHALQAGFDVRILLEDGLSVRKYFSSF